MLVPFARVASKWLYSSSLGIHANRHGCLLQYYCGRRLSCVVNGTYACENVTVKGSAVMPSKPDDTILKIDDLNSNRVSRNCVSHVTGSEDGTSVNLVSSTVCSEWNGCVEWSDLPSTALRWCMEPEGWTVSWKWKGSACVSVLTNCDHLSLYHRKVL